MKDTPTIRTLAKMAGVSNATVSLALRNHPRIRPEVRERIQQIALKAGYKTDALVANLLAQLRTKKTLAYQSTLGLLTIWENPALHKATQTFIEWISGCKERAASLGYGLDQFSLVEPPLTAERLVKILHARNIRGLLVIDSDLGDIVRPDLDPLWQYSAAIVMGVRPIEPQLSFTSNDQFDTTLRAMSEVLRLGYERPGLCIQPYVDNWVEKRFSGGFYARQNLLPRKNCVPKFEFEHDAEDRFRAWIKRHRPDVIITLHTEIMAWVKSMGLRVPEDIGLVHLDKTSGMEWAGMQQNNTHIGRAAVDMLVGQLHRNEFGIPPFQKGLFIMSTWAPGPTVRKQDRRKPKSSS
jgi:LacI family transcriptional regulator